MGGGAALPPLSRFTTRWDRVARVPAKLYSLSLSHPTQAARLMLERKGIEHEVDLFPGLHPPSCAPPAFAAAPCRL